MKEQLRPNCPPFEQLAAFHEGRLAELQSGAVRAHLDSCVVCRVELDSLAEFERAEAEPGELGDVEAIAARLRRARQPRPETPAWRKWLALPALPKLAGALAAVALLAAVTLQMQSARTRGLEGFSPSGQLRSSTAISVSPQGDLPALPGSLTWSAVPGAVGYDMVLQEVDGTEVWRGGGAQPSLILAGDVRSLFRPMKTLMFRVRALDAKGALLSESDAVRLRFAPAIQP